jgi:hypothetical protein
MGKQDKDFTYQAKFNDYLKTIIPENAILAEEVADIIHSSADAAYRRLRLETAFTLDEMMQICAHYNIDPKIVSGYNSGNSVIFNYHSMYNDENAVMTWVKNLYNNFLSVNKLDNRHTYYAAEEIPVFHYFKYPELTAFKLFYWEKTLIGYPKWEKEKFAVNKIGKEEVATAQLIYDEYLKIDSTEIWKEETIFSAIRQFDFYYESGLFENEDEALLILQQLKSLIDDIAAMSTNGVKHKYGNAFNIYKGDVMINGIANYVKAGDQAIMFQSFNSLNNIVTKDVDFCKESKTFLDQVIKCSTLISGTSEKERNKFFLAIHKIIDKQIDKVKLKEN